MIQWLFEFLLFHSIDNIKFYNFLCSTFPKLEEKYIEKEEAKIQIFFVSYLFL